MSDISGLGKRFVLFKIKNGRKIPINPRTGRFAKCNDPSTWSDYETACKTMSKWKCDCLGVALGDGIQAIDLDHCIDDKGAVSPLADSILKRFDTYAERSPSGRGIHLLARGTTDTVKLPEVEVYGGARFMTLTGDSISSSPLRPCDFNSLAKELISRRGATVSSSRPRASPADPKPKCHIPKISSEAKLKILFSKTPLSGDASLDDMCAVGILKSKGYSRLETETLMRRFRYRKKFDDRHYADGKTYLEKTLDKAFH